MVNNLEVRDDVTVKRFLSFLGLAVIIAGLAVLAHYPKKYYVSVYQTEIKPSNFTTKIDNPYFSLPVGKRLVYRGVTDQGRERSVTFVTNRTKKIMGVDTVVVKDVVWLDGQLEELTYDWYAQDKDGNVWYFGEDTHEYRRGKVVSSHGAWEAGVKGAQPGIIMKAKPQVGETWRQEYFKGEAEDMAKVLSLKAKAVVPIGTFRSCVKTEDWTPLEPDILENKYYCAGNVVLEKAVRGAKDVSKLIESRFKGGPLRLE